MVKIEIELTPEQLEKVETLQKQDISVGEAIDLLFEVKDEASSQINGLDDELKLFEKLYDSSLDVDKKTEILEENFGDSDKTYEMKVQNVKHKVSWFKDVFKF